MLIKYQLIFRGTLNKTNWHSKQNAQRDINLPLFKIKQKMAQNNYNGALQKPINSGFNAQSTASEVIQGIDLNGKIAVVTGGYAGIGLETTRVLSAAGATVIVPARDVEKASKN